MKMSVHKILISPAYKMCSDNVAIIITSIIVTNVYFGQLRDMLTKCTQILRYCYIDIRN